MPLWKIAYRSIQFRFVSSILTAFSMSLGVALIVTVIVIHGVLDASFNKGAQGYDLIIAAKGSPLDVVLSSVFYIRPAVGNVPESYLKMFQRGQYSHLIEEAIPINIGHYYRSAPIVGITLEFFTKLKYAGNKTYEFAQGDNIKYGDPYTAVIGNLASRRTGLRIGDEFKPTAVRNAQEEDDCDDHKSFKIVGILAPTGTPNDSAIFVNIDGFYDMHGLPHEEHDHEHGEDETKHYSAILLITKENAVQPPTGTAVDPNSPDFNPAALLEDRSYVNINAMELPQLLDKTSDVQAVSPVREISTLLTNIIGNIQIVMLLFAVLVVLVAGIGMMVSIYNSMSERRQEIALMRALGARRLTVMVIILLESILLSLGGGALGLVLGHLLIAGMGPWITEYTGIVVRFWNFQLAEIILIPGLILLASIVGFLPAAVAYKQDVATSLAP